MINKNTLTALPQEGLMQIGAIASLAIEADKQLFGIKAFTSRVPAGKKELETDEMIEWLNFGSKGDAKRSFRYACESLGIKPLRQERVKKITAATDKDGNFVEQGYDVNIYSLTDYMRAAGQQQQQQIVHRLKTDVMKAAKVLIKKMAKLYSWVNDIESLGHTDLVTIYSWTIELLQRQQTQVVQHNNDPSLVKERDFYRKAAGLMCQDSIQTERKLNETLVIVNKLEDDLETVKEDLAETTCRLKQQEILNNLPPAIIDRLIKTATEEHNKTLAKDVREKGLFSTL
jgi:hypothetical protein